MKLVNGKTLMGGLMFLASTFSVFSVLCDLFLYAQLIYDTDLKERNYRIVWSSFCILMKPAYVVIWKVVSCICRPLSNGQRGEVYEVDGDRVAVILDVNDVKPDGDTEEKSSESPPKPPIHWIQGDFIFQVKLVSIKELLDYFGPQILLMLKKMIVFILSRS